MSEAQTPKRKGVKRRAFLIGGAAVVGGGIFTAMYGDYAMRRDASALTKSSKGGSFAAWLRIDEDDTVTIYTPHIDMGTGNATALMQMAADELDADWDKIKIEQAPIDTAFANVWLAKGFVGEMSGVHNAPDALWSLLARNMVNQITGGSSAVRFTGQKGMRVLGASARQALLEEAAARLNAPLTELSAAKGVITHAKSGKTLRYGELAIAASERSLNDEPKLKEAKDFAYIGKFVPRRDIPGKVDGSAQYGIDVHLPNMRVACVANAPVRGGEVTSMDEDAAKKVRGVEKVVKLENAVAVIANGYWPAHKGILALAPQFSDGGNGDLDTAKMFAEQEKLCAETLGGITAGGGKAIAAKYRAPYLHHMMMETFAITAHMKDGKLDIWAGMQDPLATKTAAADAAGLSMDDVTYHPLLLGGGFGRKLPGIGGEIITQAVALAKESEHPVKVIWPREDEVGHGTYRPQSAIAMRLNMDDSGKITHWHSAFAQAKGFEAGMKPLYDIAEVKAEFAEYATPILTAAWRSVEASQHGFFHESLVDEAAHSLGMDPLEFRMKNVQPNSRAAKVLAAVAKASGWGTPLPAGTGRGIAIVESFGTVAAHVIETAIGDDGYPKVNKVWAAVDCGQVVSPKNAEAQIQGGIVMGLSSAIHEEITIDKGAVVQKNFGDYPILSLKETPEIYVEFIPSDAPMGGLGEPGLPPVAPALTNALFALTGKRIRNLPIRDQAKV